MADSCSADATFTKVGDYEVLVADKPVAFWPLLPEALDAGTVVHPLLFTPNLPTTLNTAYIPIFGIFDIVVEMPEDAVTEQIAAITLANAVSGFPAIKKMPFLRPEAGRIRICFAVDHASLAAGALWQGKLRLTGKYKSGNNNKNAVLEVPLAQAQQSTVNNLVVWFNPHKKPPKKHAWVKLKVVEASDGTTPIPQVWCDLKLLRDNLGSGYNNVNRRVVLGSMQDGYVGLDPKRDVVAVPTSWPLIFTVTKDGHVRRAHMVRLEPADADNDNQHPKELTALRMTKISDATLKGKKFLLDPGHGVVYGLAKARRVQEWYVANRIAERVSEILRTVHQVKPEDIFWTRTAGFGLIEPGQIHANGAPENGDKRFKVDLPTRRIRAAVAAVGLHDISSLLQTRHQDPNDAAIAITEADRNQFLVDNKTTITAIEVRTNATLAPKHQRIRTGSIRWDAATSQYVYTLEKVAGTQVTVVNETAPFPILTTDWFTLNQQALENLADRSARWSIACEVGSGPGASGSRPSFNTAAKAALRNANALAYMKDTILAFLNVTAPHPYLNYGVKGWSPSNRLNYFTLVGGTCDVVISFHENAGGGKGGMLLVSHKTGVDAPPAAQIKLAKIFVKYLDWFDQGVRQSGIATDLPANPAAMLYHGNTVREHHAYFESEFMDAIVPDDPNKYRYEQMVEPATINGLASEIVDGIVEALLDPQADLDPVTCSGNASLQGLW